MRRIQYLVFAVLLFGATSCWSTRHVVGAGARQGITVSEDAWWFCWGFFSLDEPNTASMAGDSTSYEVTTELSFLDFLIGLPTGFLVTRTTVTVEK